MRIAVLSSVGTTLDSFFPEIIDEWNLLGSTVFTAASTEASVSNFTRLSSVTRRPAARNVNAPSEIRAWLDRTNVDVLVTNTATASALARLGRGTVPVVYFCHGLHWNEGTSAIDRMWQFMETRLIRRTAGVVTINSDDQAWFDARLDASRILRLKGGVGVPLDRYPSKPAPSSARIKLLWAGEFSNRKQPLEAVEVMRHLRDANLDVSLTMLGDGALHGAVQRNVDESGLADRISLPGRGDFAAYMTGCHALLHTAKWEGLPRVMLEACAMGRTSYAFDVKGVRDAPAVTLSSEPRARSLADLIGRDMISGRIRGGAVAVEGLDVRVAARLVHEFLVRIARLAGGVNGDQGSSRGGR